MNQNMPIQVYQLGRELPSIVQPLAKKLMHSQRIRKLFVPEHALIYNGGMYRGRGQHLPGCLTLMLAHDYRTRDVEQDFPLIDAALIALNHSQEGAVSIRPAPGSERGLDDLQIEFNFYREMRDVTPKVKW